MIKVTIYNEFVHEKVDDYVASIYPEGIHMAIKQGIEDEEIQVKTVTLDNVSEGITEQSLADTDVLIWWGHGEHHLVPDEVSELVKNAVLGGMGAIFLHSSHHSKPFKALMGTSCNLTYRENADYEFLWVCNPSHPIARGIERYIYLPNVETYGEPFAVPEPDEVVFIGGYKGGEVFRSGCCWKRENGKIFYFQPGHESCPIYNQPDILKVIKNAVYWAKSDYRTKIDCVNVDIPLKEIKS